MVGEKFYCAQCLAHLRGGREGSNYLPAIACPWITCRKDTIICSKSCGALCRSHDELLVCAAECDCEMQAYVSAISNSHFGDFLWGSEHWGLKSEGVEKGVPGGE